MAESRLHGEGVSLKKGRDLRCIEVVWQSQQKRSALWKYCNRWSRETSSWVKQELNYSIVSSEQKHLSVFCYIVHYIVFVEITWNVVALFLVAFLWIQTSEALNDLLKPSKTKCENTRGHVWSLQIFMAADRLYLPPSSLGTWKCIHLPKNSAGHLQWQINTSAGVHPPLFLIFSGLLTVIPLPHLSLSHLFAGDSSAATLAKPFAKKVERLHRLALTCYLLVIPKRDSASFSLLSCQILANCCKIHSISMVNNVAKDFSASVSRKCYTWPPFVTSEYYEVKSASNMVPVRQKVTQWSVLLALGLKVFNMNNMRGSIPFPSQLVTYQHFGMHPWRPTRMLKGTAQWQKPHPQRLASIR